MVHAAEVLERLLRDVQVVIKNFSLDPTDFPRGLIFLVRGCPRSRLFARPPGHLREDSCTVAIRREFKTGPFFASSLRWESACSQPSVGALRACRRRRASKSRSPPVTAKR